MGTICDRCSEEILVEESNTCDILGNWEGATLCNNCYAEIGNAIWIGLVTAISAIFSG